MQRNKNSYNGQNYFLLKLTFMDYFMDTLHASATLVRRATTHGREQTELSFEEPSTI